VVREHRNRSIDLDRDAYSFSTHRDLDALPGRPGRELLIRADLTLTGCDILLHDQTDVVPRVDGGVDQLDGTVSVACRSRNQLDVEGASTASATRNEPTSIPIPSHASRENLVRILRLQAEFVTTIPDAVAKISTRQ
jgi:hypothetical protein